jgi:hypothetical protein
MKLPVSYYDHHLGDDSVSFPPSELHDTVTQKTTFEIITAVRI